MSYKYIYYYQLQEIFKEYQGNKDKSMRFVEALKIAKARNIGTNKKLILEKRTHLSHDEFLYYLNHTQIDYQFHLNPNKVYRDSSLIPNELNLFALKNIIFAEQIVHPHNCFDIHYVYSGCAILIFENQTHLIEEGELCILTPHSPYRLYTETEDDIVITIYIRNSTFEELFYTAFTEFDLISLFIRNAVYNSGGKNNYLLFKGNHLDDIKEIIQNIFIETNYVDSYSNITSIQWANLLFATILRDFSFEHSYLSFDTKKNIYFVEILEYVQTHYQTVTIKELSQKFHYNESYISTMFKKYLGSNFVTIVSQLRINHAKSLLLETDLTIEKISEIVGYTSVDHFSRTFKKQTSLSPSIYRNNIQ